MTATRATARYFDELEIGERFVTGEWTLSEAEIVAFARTFDPQPIHIDAARAASMWIGWGSNVRAKATISASLSVHSPVTKRSPISSSSK